MPNQDNLSKFKKIFFFIFKMDFITIINILSRTTDREYIKKMILYKDIYNMDDSYWKLLIDKTHKIYNLTFKDFFIKLFIRIKNKENEILSINVVMTRLSIDKDYIKYHLPQTYDIFLYKYRDKYYYGYKLGNMKEVSIDELIKILLIYNTSYSDVYNIKNIEPIIYEIYPELKNAKDIVWKKYYINLLNEYILNLELYPRPMFPTTYRDIYIHLFNKNILPH